MVQRRRLLSGDKGFKITKIKGKTIGCYAVNFLYLLTCDGEPITDTENVTVTVPSGCSYSWLAGSQLDIHLSQNTSTRSLKSNTITVSYNGQESSWTITQSRFPLYVTDYSYVIDNRNHVYPTPTYIGGLYWDCYDYGCSSTDAKNVIGGNLNNSYSGTQWGSTQHLSSGYDGDWSIYPYGNDTDGFTKYNTQDQKSVLDSVDDAASVSDTDNKGWRIPTLLEYQNLFAATNVNLGIGLIIVQTSTTYTGYGIYLTPKYGESNKGVWFPLYVDTASTNTQNTTEYHYWCSTLYNPTMFAYHYASYIRMKKNSVSSNYTDRNAVCKIRAVHD